MPFNSNFNSILCGARNPWWMPHGEHLSMSMQCAWCSHRTCPQTPRVEWVADVLLPMSVSNAEVVQLLSDTHHQAAPTDLQAPGALAVAAGMAFVVAGQGVLAAAYPGQHPLSRCHRQPGRDPLGDPPAALVDGNGVVGAVSGLACTAAVGCCIPNFSTRTGISTASWPPSRPHGSSICTCRCACAAQKVLNIISFV
jgi:hypothetical protein